MKDEIMTIVSHRFTPFVALFLTVFAVYFTALDGQFVYDDEFLIQKNQLLDRPELWSSFFRTSSTYGAGGSDSFYRPLQLLSYALVYQIDGANPFYFHLWNVVLHGLGSLLLFVLLLRLFESRSFAFWVSLLWVVHPVHVEAIAYASGTADPLYLCFGLGALILAIRDGIWFRVLSLALFMLALLSKETAVVLSGLVLLCVLVKTRNFKVTVFRTLPFLLLAGFYTSLRGSILNLDQSFQFYSEANVYTQSFLVRLWTAFAATTDYFLLMIWPHPLSIDREYGVFVSPWNMRVILGFAIFAASMALAVWSWRKKKLVFFLGATWFWCAHALHTGVLLPLNSLFLEHWLYLPSVGVMLLLGRVSYLVFKEKFWLPLLLPVFAWSAVSISQNKVWHDSFTLYPHILKFSPSVARVHNNLAMAYSERGDLNSAETHYLRAIEIRDDYPQVRHNLALVYMAQGHPQKALEQFEKAIAMKPDFFHSYPYMAKCYEILGNPAKVKEALELYERYRPKF